MSLSIKSNRRLFGKHLVGKISWPFKAGQDFGPSMVRLGKAKSGRMLDGVTHDAMPTEVARVY